jgi:hypothetical protein
MRRAPACVLLLLALAPALAAAQARSVFPYEAVIETDGTPIHSGPGGKFYETARLKRGTKVTVHRHDPGGWYMIEPPASEFSLVKADAVRPLSQGAVEIIADTATVRVGSQTAGRHDVEQVEFAHGDRAEVLEGVTAPAGWVAIRPPRGEYRWVPGRFVVPVPEQVRSELDADPFAVPSVAKRPESFDEALPEISPAFPASPEGPQLSLGNPESEPGATNVAGALRTLDRDLEGLALAEPTDWPLDELADEYRRLRAANPSMGRQIDVRIAQIERMRLVKEQYGDYVRLTSATDSRDAELLAKHAVPAAMPQTQQAAGPTLAPPMLLAAEPQESATPLPPPAPPAEGRPQIQGGPPYATTGIVNAAPAAPAQASTVSMAEERDASGPLLLAPEAEAPAPALAGPAPARLVAAPQPLPAAAKPAPAAPNGPRRFDAVGVVQKAVDPHPEAPQYVLVAPNGRILVYLREQPGISLEKFVGHPMGVDGARHKHPELTTPMIVVDRLTPVRF